MSGRRPTTRKTPTLEAEDCEDSDGTALDGLRFFVIAGEERSKVAGSMDPRVSTRMRIDSSLRRRSFFVHVVAYHDKRTSSDGFKSKRCSATANANFLATQCSEK